MNVEMWNMKKRSGLMLWIKDDLDLDIDLQCILAAKDAH